MKHTKNIIMALAVMATVGYTAHSSASITAEQEALQVLIDFMDS